MVIGFLKAKKQKDEKVLASSPNGENHKKAALGFSTIGTKSIPFPQQRTFT